MVNLAWRTGARVSACVAFVTDLYVLLFLIGLTAYLVPTVSGSESLEFKNSHNKIVGIIGAVAIFASGYIFLLSLKLVKAASASQVTEAERAGVEWRNAQLFVLIIVVFTMLNGWWSFTIGYGTIRAFTLFAVCKFVQ